MTPLFRSTVAPEVEAARAKYPWMIAAYLSFGLALLVILSIAAWGASVDFEEARASLLRAEVNRLRSHAVRSVIRLQDLMSFEEKNEGKVIGLDSPEVNRFLNEQWQRHIPEDPSRSYAALTDKHGKILVHYRPELVGGRLDGNWATRSVPEAGEDVVETSDSRLTGDGSRALDVMIPVLRDSKEIGTYHSGFKQSWFDEQLSLKRRATTLRWGVAFVIISVVTILAGVSLLHVARRLSSLQGVVAMGHVQRLADLGALAGGIAHEVRNPMNAIRLNLHVIKKLTSQGRFDDHTESVMDETIREMERVDGLLRTMLEYARPALSSQETVDLASEVRSVVNFLSPLLERERMRITTVFGHEKLLVRADRGQIRQIALNLIKNAMEAVGIDGRIEVRCASAGDEVELVVADEGPGVPLDRQNRIFDPFFSTKEIGTGLGLTLVKRYVESSGGSITYRDAIRGGAEFTVRLPSAATAVVESGTAESFGEDAAVPTASAPPPPPAAPHSEPHNTPLEV